MCSMGITQTHLKTLLVMTKMMPLCSYVYSLFFLTNCYCFLISVCDVVCYIVEQSVTINRKVGNEGQRLFRIDS